MELLPIALMVLFSQMSASPGEVFFDCCIIVQEAEKQANIIGVGNHKYHSIDHQKSQTLLPWHIFGCFCLLLSYSSPSSSSFLLFRTETKTSHLYYISLPLSQDDHAQLLTILPRHSFLRLSQSIGQIFSLRFDSHLIVVISSASIAEDCFSHNDIVLANRPLFFTGNILNYDFSTLLTAPYGPRWLSLHDTCNAQIFSSIRLHSLSYIWSEADADLVRKIIQKSLHGKVVVALRPLFREMMFEIILRILGVEKKDLRIVMDTIDDILKQAETLNLEDFSPFQRWAGFRGYKRKQKRTAMAADELLQKILDKRRSENGTREDNLIDNLLELQQSEPELYNDEMIKGLVLVMLLAGPYTSAASIEWAMSLLLNHPSVLLKAKNEVDNQVGQNREVKQSDVPMLAYLENIISETLRLYLPSPLLTPRYSSDDCMVAGYRIPRGTTVFVNAWAIQRDPNLWDDPTTFRPERFVGRDVSSHQYMPFGLGRRACPGAGLSKHVMVMTLASLIQCFEWERCGEEEVDMTPGNGVTDTKAKPLEAVCKARSTVCAAYV